MAMRDMFYFFVLFLLMFCGFVFSGYVLFGPEAMISNVASSSVTLLRMSIGDIEFHKFIEGDRQIAPMYFVLFTILFYFIMTNIFLSIILDVWHKEEEVRDNPRKQGGHSPYGRFKGYAMKYIKTIVSPVRTCRFWTFPDEILAKICLEKMLWKREDMGLEEIKERLKLWRNKRQNQDYNFVDFPLIVKALEGGHLNHKDVSDEQVQNVMAMCKPPPNSQILYI